LRKQLLGRRDYFATTAAISQARGALIRHLVGVLSDLEPELLGLYWPLGSEFNAVTALHGDSVLAKLPFALPFARRSPIQMEYRAWDGQTPIVTDECGIASSGGAVVTPDVALVPCVGFTESGFRLGYGGGYFDRWLAQHPFVTTVGVAWSVGKIEKEAFDACAHDQPLTLIVTEQGVL
jgi:5-formyltetrahydrofolate cyclo-ligase